MVAEDPWGDGLAAAKTSRKAVEDQKAGLPKTAQPKGAHWSNVPMEAR